MKYGGCASLEVRDRAGRVHPYGRRGLRYVEAVLWEEFLLPGRDSRVDCCHIHLFGRGSSECKPARQASPEVTVEEERCSWSPPSLAKLSGNLVLR